MGGEDDTPGRKGVEQLIPVHALHVGLALPLGHGEVERCLGRILEPVLAPEIAAIFSALRSTGATVDDWSLGVMPFWY